MKMHLRALRSAPELIQLLIAYEWIKAGIEKILKPDFVQGMEKTLQVFATHNPYSWYASSVLVFAQSRPQAFGLLVEWGELCIGIGLLFALGILVFRRVEHDIAFARMVSITSLFFGAFLNAQFYFAAGWMQASTAGLNIILFWAQVILIWHWSQVKQMSA